MDKTAKTEENKSLKILEEVVYKIVEIAAADVDGVCGFVKSRVDFTQLFIRSATQSKINIRIDSGSAEISLWINVSGNCRVKSTAEKVQKRVKNDVQSMTGIAVTKVNVYVKGIVFENE